MTAAQTAAGAAAPAVEPAAAVAWAARLEALAAGAAADTDSGEDYDQSDDSSESGSDGSDSDDAYAARARRRRDTAADVRRQVGQEVARRSALELQRLERAALVLEMAPTQRWIKRALLAQRASAEGVALLALLCGVWWPCVVPVGDEAGRCAACGHRCQDPHVHLVLGRGAMGFRAPARRRRGRVS